MWFENVVFFVYIMCVCVLCLIPSHFCVVKKLQQFSHPYTSCVSVWFITGFSAFSVFVFLLYMVEYISKVKYNKDFFFLHTEHNNNKYYIMYFIYVTKFLSWVAFRVPLEYGTFGFWVISLTLYEKNKINNNRKKKQTYPIVIPIEYWCVTSIE